MSRESKEHSQARREEILDACARLYAHQSFKEITIKEIGTQITCSRSSIYNYFESKEEIFLALLQREYELWIDWLQGEYEKRKPKDRESFARLLAESIEQRPMMNKMLSMNHYDMESLSRMENLVEFKKVYGKTMESVESLLRQTFPSLSDDEAKNFIYAFFPFLFGLYAYGNVDERQKEAMEKAGLNFLYLSPYELIYRCVMQLLSQRI